MADEFYTFEEARQKLNLSEDEIIELAGSGALHAVGRDSKFRRDEIDNYQPGAAAAEELVIDDNLEELGIELGEEPVAGDELTVELDGENLQSPPRAAAADDDPFAELSLEPVELNEKEAAPAPAAPPAKAAPKTLPVPPAPKLVAPKTTVSAVTAANKAETSVLDPVDLSLDDDVNLLEPDEDETAKAPEPESAPKVMPKPKAPAPAPAKPALPKPEPVKPAVKPVLMKPPKKEEVAAPKKEAAKEIAPEADEDIESMENAPIAEPAEPVAKNAPKKSAVSARHKSVGGKKFNPLFAGEAEVKSQRKIIIVPPRFSDLEGPHWRVILVALVVLMLYPAFLIGFRVFFDDTDAPSSIEIGKQKVPELRRPGDKALINIGEPYVPEMFAWVVKQKLDGNKTLEEFFPSRKTNAGGTSGLDRFVPYSDRVARGLVKNLPKEVELAAPPVEAPKAVPDADSPPESDTYSEDAPTDYYNSLQ
ncbi:hypothetical protein FACS1894139_08370 [Planctomycetales bacterium]|nr:hypothetical protein FACS1894108_01510 [Planctomycetales bacterium]GHT05112.1 hypothetical protein FACS1894139_08370 [Planctomycetales bacterium]